MEADVLSGAVGDPIVIDRETIVTPSALDRARLLGIRVRYECDDGQVGRCGGARPKSPNSSGEVPVKTLLTAADIEAHRGSGPLVAAKGAVLTPGAVARASALGIQIAEGASGDVSRCGCDSSTRCESGCECSSGGTPASGTPAGGTPASGGPVASGIQPVPSNPIRSAGVLSGWSLDFDRRGVDPELFRAGGRQRPRTAGASAFGSLHKRGIDPSLFRSSAAKPTFSPRGSDQAAGGVEQSKESTGSRTGAWLVTLAGTDAPGRLSESLRHLETLGAIKESRHRTEGGVFQLVAVVSANSSASAEAVAKGLEQRGLTAIIHRA